jgi:hypothetical protein
MKDTKPTLPSADISTICANHTQRLQLLFGKFWNGELTMWQYRKQSRELTQQFVNELEALFNHGLPPASSATPARIFPNHSASPK